MRNKMLFAIALLLMSSVALATVPEPTNWWAYEQDLTDEKGLVDGNTISYGNPEIYNLCDQFTYEQGIDGYALRFTNYTSAFNCSSKYNRPMVYFNATKTESQGNIYDYITINNTVSLWLKMDSSNTDEDNSTNSLFLWYVNDTNDYGCGGLWYWADWDVGTTDMTMAYYIDDYDCNYVWVEDCIGTTKINDDRWHLLTWTMKDGYNWSMYVDGQPIDPNDCYVDADINSTEPLDPVIDWTEYVNQEQPNLMLSADLVWNNEYESYYDDTKLWTFALSESQVLELYNSYCTNQTCGEGESCCEADDSDYCTDLDQDEQNCGTCGNTCSGDETCESGVCVAPPEPVSPVTLMVSILIGGILTMVLFGIIANNYMGDSGKTIGKVIAIAIAISVFAVLMLIIVS